MFARRRMRSVEESPGRSAHSALIGVDWLPDSPPAPGRGSLRERMFRFTLVDADKAESLGIVAFARPDFNVGDVIPQGAGRSLRVVNVIEAEKEDELPVLVVERTR